MTWLRYLPHLRLHAPCLCCTTRFVENVSWCVNVSQAVTLWSERSWLRAACVCIALGLGGSMATVPQYVMRSWHGVGAQGSRLPPSQHRGLCMRSSPLVSCVALRLIGPPPPSWGWLIFTPDWR